MPANTSYSVQAARFRASPPTKVPGYEIGDVRKVHLTLSLTAEDTTDVGDILALWKFGSDVVIRDIQVKNTDLDAGGPTLTMNAGVYADNNGAVGSAKAATAYVDGSTVFQSASTLWTSIQRKAASTTVKRLFEDAGDTATTKAPEYWVALTVKAAPTTPAAGTVEVVIEYETY